MKALFKIVSVLLLFHLGGYARSQAQEAQRVGYAEEVSATVADFRSTDGGPLEWSITRGTLSGYMRLEISKLNLPADSEVTLRDRFGDTVQTLKGPISNSGAFYSDVIFGDQVFVSLYNAHAAASQISINKVYYEYQFTVQNSVYDHDDRVQIDDPSLAELIRDDAKSVVFISFVIGDDYKVCSGFYIGDGSFITNQHCLGDQKICDSAVIVLDYDLDDFGAVKHGSQYQCKAVFVPDDRTLDYVTFTVDGLLPKLTPLPFLLEDVPPLTDAVLIQHPGGEPKQAVVIGCSVLDTPVQGRAAQSDFTHRCDTLGGSSGSPVLVTMKGKSGEPTLCVVGLHHYGFEETDPFSTYNRAVRSALLTRDFTLRHVSFQKCGGST